MASSSARPTGKILLAAALALLLAGTADARTSSKVIASGVLLKGGMYAYAQGNAVWPKSLSARVTTIPSQKVLLKWSVVCAKKTAPAAAAEGYNASTASKTGQKTVTSPATAALPMPFARPKTCSVSVYARLVVKAKATLQILQG